MPTPTRRIAGCMTGTSLDAIDAAMVEISGAGPTMSARVLEHRAAPLGGLGPRLRAYAEGASLSAADSAGLALEFGRALAEAIGGLPGPAPELCVLHGQTVCHAPPVSLQLVNPWPVAHELGCAVVFDLRSADLVAGGQGAPITPAADRVLFSDPCEDRVIVNLGGFCNLTILPKGPGGTARGEDVCACNQVLDAVARDVLGCAHDAGGAVAQAGAADQRAARALADTLRAQHLTKRSLGTGDEAAGWVRAHRDRLEPRDLAASAAAAVGGVIRDAAARALPGARVFLAGGGVHNAALVAAIGSDETTAALGVDPSAREAAEMAVLGALAQDGIDITEPGTTGRGGTVPPAGAWIGGSR